MEVVTLDVRGASLVNDESGIYRGGAQTTLVIDFKLKCEHEILVEANTSYTQKKYKYELKTNEQVIQQIQSQHCSNITLFVQQPKILQGMVESKILWLIRICGA